MEHLERPKIIPLPSTFPAQRNTFFRCGLFLASRAFPALSLSCPESPADSRKSRRWKHSGRQELDLVLVSGRGCLSRSPRVDGSWEPLSRKEDRGAWGERFPFREPATSWPKQPPHSHLIRERTPKEGWPAFSDSLCLGFLPRTWNGEKLRSTNTITAVHAEALVRKNLV